MSRIHAIVGEIGAGKSTLRRRWPASTSSLRASSCSTASLSLKSPAVWSIKQRDVQRSARAKGVSGVTGGAGTATRTIGLFGGILTYAVEAGIITTNPAHGLRKPKDNVRTRRLTEAEYRTLGEMLTKAGEDEKYATTVEIIRQIALTGCRRPAPSITTMRDHPSRLGSSS